MALPVICPECGQSRPEPFPVVGCLVFFVVTFPVAVLIAVVIWNTARLLVTSGIIW